MRVIAARVRQMGSHVGRWQPIRDMRYPPGEEVNSHDISLQTELMQVLSTIMRCLVTCEMAGINAGTSAHPCDIVWHSVESLMHPVVEWGRDPEQSRLASKPRRGRHFNPATIAHVLSKAASPVACVRLQFINSTMQRERQRMCSRRGGSRGRATTQRQGPISPSSSSIEVTSVPQQLHGSSDGGGRGTGRDGRVEGGQDEYPTFRYRLPCPLANSTLIITVTVEPGAIQSAQADAIQATPPPGHGTEPIMERQHHGREDSPIACHSVLAGTSQYVHGRGSAIDLERPVKECSPLACPSALAGPSEPVLGRPSSAVIPLSDSDDSLLFGCRVEEAPYTTDEE